MTIKTGILKTSSDIIPICPTKIVGIRDLATVKAKTSKHQWLWRLLLVLVLGSAWYITTRAAIWPPYLVPPPSDVFDFIKISTSDGTLIGATTTSIARAASGFAIAALIGLPTGLLLAKVSWLDDLLSPAVGGLQSLPSICWFPLALLWFGMSEAAVLFVVVMGALFAIILAVRSGVRNLPPLTERAGVMLGARGIKLWWYVLIPASLPAILAGMRQAWAFAWRSLMAAELLSQSLKVGIGHVLTTGRDLNDMAMVLGTIVIILVLGLLVDRIAFRPIEAFIARRWGVDGA